MLIKNSCSAAVPTEGRDPLNADNGRHRGGLIFCYAPFTMPQSSFLKPCSASWYLLFHVKFLFQLLVIFHLFFFDAGFCRQAQIIKIKLV